MIDLIKRYWYIPVVIASALFLWIGFTAGTYRPQSSQVTQLVDKLLEQEKAKLAKDIETERNKYKDIVNQKDYLIGELQKKIGASQANYQAAKKEIERLRKEIAANVPPVTVDEARKRLTEAGYNSF